MPVQINEMVIRANIINPAEAQQSGVKSSTSGELNKDEIIKECAALVIEILQSKNQR